MVSRINTFQLICTLGFQRFLETSNELILLLQV